MASSTSPRTWRCEVCLDDHKDYASINIDDHKFCTACIKQLFDKALAHEFHWPAKSHRTVLHPTQFPHVVSVGFITAYKADEREYKCENFRRGYCAGSVSAADGKGEAKPYGIFVGRLHYGEDPNVYAVSSCASCKQMSCLNCGHGLERLTDLGYHDCVTRISLALEKAKKEENVAFAGLRQGRDFQICPNESCQRRIQLSEACNHVVCAYCGMSFCFVCGTPQAEDGGHWQRSGYPRYNLPGEEGARHDDQSLAGSDYAETQPDSRPHSPFAWGNARALGQGWDNRPAQGKV
ncbi:hypothetical protein LTR78_002669 [Recurvomyces mirabilis]|uniref:RBR-type E3 ubiquitin transferase n=1 Tax=Recurvomyces mirabilis TaxID=574656 RepID=A0AAE1C4R2_9PEZI|nr:hypothetical protein LTR78_002669 [Recurvomyces mirabilis]KAK5157598.1 hypothetical protein LTS14_004363 [Recurvomyces mirabilis]